MQKIIGLTLLTLLVLACSEPKNESKKQQGFAEGFNKVSYQIEITDTVYVNYIAREFKLMDTNHSGSQHLLMSSLEKDSILRVGNSGQILSKYSVKGQGDNKAGEVIYSVGFGPDEKTFIVCSSEGFFTFDLETGDYISHVPEKTYPKGYGGSYSFNVEVVDNNNQLEYAAFLETSLRDKNIYKFTRQHLTDYQPITFVSAKDGQKNNRFGVSKNSIYFRDDYHYGELYTMFAYSDQQQQFAVINNPSDRVLVYDIDGNLIQDIALGMEHFKLPIKFKYNRTTDEGMDKQIVNSMHRNLQFHNGQILVTYRSGLPLSVFESLKSYSELPSLFKKHMKYYTKLVDVKNKLISDDIILPENAVGVASFTGKDQMWLYTNPAVTETDNATVFYKAKLIKN